MEFYSLVEAMRRELAVCVRTSSAEDIPWGWVGAAVAELLSENSSGISRAVLLTELEAQWHKVAMGEVMQYETLYSLAPFFNCSIKPPPSTVFGLKIDGTKTIPNTQIWLWRVSGAPEPTDVSNAAAKNTNKRRRDADMQMDAFVHQRFYPMIEAREFSGFFDNTRTLFATNLWMADRGGGSGGQPVHTLLPTTSLAFELRLRDNVKQTETANKHTDEALLQRVFGVRFVGGQFVRDGKPEFSADQIWCKIGEVGEIKTKWRDRRLVLYCFIEGVLEHEDPPVTVTIGMWAEDVAVARLFKTGFYIGLLCPIVKSCASGSASMEAELGPQTIVFITSPCRSRSAAAGPGMASQFSIAQNESGLLDYRRYAHRVQLCQCHTDMINLTLLARVIAVSNNMPFEENGETQDRYAVRIDDGTAVRDITFWNQLGQQAARMLPGQLVLLVNLDTSDENGDVVLNGSSETGTKVYIISEMASIPTSSALRSCSFLSTLSDTANVYAKVCIVSIHPGATHIRDARDNLSATMLVHTTCHHPVQRKGNPQFSGTLDGPADVYDFVCPACRNNNLPPEDVISIFDIIVCIDDGTLSLMARTTATVAKAILRISPSQMLELPSSSEQQQKLLAPQGKEVVVSLTTFCEPFSTDHDVRIDAICDADDVGIFVSR
ncbi:hypothetical protein IWW40_004882 [Coemansia sp. RSA 1250]|nr:hypothetical protein IWW40_004882 [Coemansia sp. RSA 1250]